MLLNVLIFQMMFLKMLIVGGTLHIGKFFKYNKWESVKELICLLGRLDVLHIENIRRINFIKNMSVLCDSNKVIVSVFNYYIHKGEFYSVLCKYDTIDYSWSHCKIKAIIYNSFQKIATKAQC